MHSVKCLIVDDLDENLLALSALLQQDGVELLTAHSGAEALELLLVHEVALALLDVQMPEMDGFELAELMRGTERTRHVPIIFVTAGARDLYRQFRGYDAGAVDFLFKPIDPPILKSKAEVFFQLYRQRQQLAEQLHERTEMLKLSEIFVAVLGHDLRNPLNAIVNSAQLLQHQSNDPSVVKTADLILSSGQRMGRMIQDILELARTRLAGGIKLKREPIDLGALVERVIGEHQAVYRTQQIEFHRRGSLMVEWDADRFAQVASNMISNALQYGAADVPIEVYIDGTHEDQVKFSVINGGSIPEHVLPHIFDPFRNASRDSMRNKGLGLGLYIVEQFVLAHGGAVDIESGANDRTAIHVTMPRR